MKILFLTPRFFPDRGGVETHVETVARQLIDKGHRVTVISIGDGSAKEMEFLDGILILRIVGIDRENKLEVWQRTVKLLRQFRDADVVHVHDVFWWILPIYLLVKSKVFVTFHGWEGEFPVPLKNKILRLLWAKLAKGSIHVGDCISDFYFDKPDLVTYGGVDIQKLEKTRKIFQKSDAMQIVFVGRLEEENNILKFIQLYKKIKKKNKKAKIIFVGDGKYRKQCQKVGKVTGMIDFSKVSQQIAGADFVFASSYLSILQAQAMGKVVVSVYDNSLKEKYLESFPGSEFMLIDGKIDLLAEQVFNLFNDTEKREKLENSALKFAQSLSWEKVTELYLQLWTKK